MQSSDPGGEHGRTWTIRAFDLKAHVVVYMQPLGKDAVVTDLSVVFFFLLYPQASVNAGLEEVRKQLQDSRGSRVRKSMSSFGQSFSTCLRGQSNSEDIHLPP